MDRQGTFYSLRTNPSSDHNDFPPLSTRRSSWSSRSGYSSPPRATSVRLFEWSVEPETRNQDSKGLACSTISLKTRTGTVFRRTHQFDLSFQQSPRPGPSNEDPTVALGKSQNECTESPPPSRGSDSTQCEGNSQNEEGIVLDYLDNIILSWQDFLNTADEYVQTISQRSIQDDGSKRDYGTLFRDLEQLHPLWPEVREEISKARSTARQLRERFFSDDAEIDAKARKYVKLRIHDLEDCYEHATRLWKHSRDLTHRVLNMANLEENRSNQEIAKSVRRIAIITFVYLPLQLGAAILQEIDDDAVPDHTWIFIALAVGIMIWTVLWWYFWSWFSRRLGPLVKKWKFGRRKNEQTPGDMV